MATQVIYIPCMVEGCNQLTPRGRLHCDDHLKEFKPKYRKYKNITRRNQIYLDDPSLVKKLPLLDQRLVATELYVAAHLRKEFQAGAIKPHKRDMGHLQIIDKMLEISKKILCRLDRIEDVDGDSEDSDTSLIDVPQEDTEMTSPNVIDTSQGFEEMVVQGIEENIRAISNNLKTINQVVREIERINTWKVNVSNPEILALGHLNIINSAVKSLLRYKDYDVVVQIVIDIKDYLKIIEDPHVKHFSWSEYLAVALSKNDIPNPLTLINQENKELVLRVLSSVLAGIRLIGSSFICNLSYKDDMLIELDRNCVVKKTGSIIYSKTSIAGISNSMCIKLS